MSKALVSGVLEEMLRVDATTGVGGVNTPNSDTNSRKESRIFITGLPMLTHIILPCKS